MTRPIGIAFQGGGAKVISLIAAADAISGLIKSGALKVERVSGTSAGSLAALLLSADADFAKVKTALRKQEKFIKEKFARPRKSSALTKVGKFLAFGTPFYDASDFNTVLENVLGEAGIDINKQIQDDNYGEIPLHVIVSDIFRGTSISVSTGGLRDVLRRSCGIPVIFTSHKSQDQGQFADGGIFDNMPIDVLVEKLGIDVPVFAIGFKPDRASSPSNSFQYMSALVGSVISNNVLKSSLTIGSDYIFPVETAITTLDFDKMISIELNEEYDTIRESTRSFFTKWLSGDANYATQAAGQRAFAKLRMVENQIVSRIESDFRAVPGRYEYAKMSVVALSLQDSNRPDEIIMENVLVVPANYSLHGVVIPFLNGSGSFDRVECDVKVGGANGVDIPFTQFSIQDEQSVRGTSTKRHSLVILLSSYSRHDGLMKIYIRKKELRFGFMLPLASGSDILGITAQYWEADEVSIRLILPPGYADVQADWSGRGSSYPVEEATPMTETVRSDWVVLAAKLAKVPHQGQLKGMFTKSGP